MLTPRQQECVDLEAQGLSQREIADKLGIVQSAVAGHIKLARKKLSTDPAVQSAMDHIGSELVPNMVWVKTKATKDAPGFSVMLKPEAQVDQPEDVLDRIADRLNRIQPAPAIQRPKAPRTDLRNFLPLFDVHMSMRVGDYGTAACVKRLQDGASDLMDRMPAAECTLIVNGGDFSHQNDPSNLTPQSKHPLPVDAEYDETTDVCIDVTVQVIETVLAKSERVEYKALRGNHDPNTARILRAALRERYRNEPRVSIQVDGIEGYAHAWGGVMIAAIHGDIRANVKDLALRLMAKHRGDMAAVKCFEVYTGHLHHIKAQELPGVTFRQVRAISAADRHSEEEMHSAISEMIGVTYHKRGARHCETNHYFD